MEKKILGIAAAGLILITGTVFGMYYPFFEAGNHFPYSSTYYFSPLTPYDKQSSQWPIIEELLKSGLTNIQSLSIKDPLLNLSDTYKNKEMEIVPFQFRPHLFVDKGKFLNYIDILKANLSEREQEILKQFRDLVQSISHPVFGIFLERTGEKTLEIYFDIAGRVEKKDLLVCDC